MADEKTALDLARERPGEEQFGGAARYRQFADDFEQWERRLSRIDANSPEQIEKLRTELAQEAASVDSLKKTVSHLVAEADQLKAAWVGARRKLNLAVGALERMYGAHAWDCYCSACANIKAVLAKIKESK